MKILLVLATLLSFSLCIPPFPDDFIWGTATSAYQIEGGWEDDGRGPSIWDVYAHQGNIDDKSNGDVADDHYHKFEEDVQLLKNLTVKWYRMSISWSRIMPNGTAPVNQKGIDHYLNELTLLQNAGIGIFMTLYHWDLPQGLQDAYGGWTNRSTVDAFVNYADIVFSSFGPFVTHWLTFNEPWCSSWLGNGVCAMAPGRGSYSWCKYGGDSTREPYIVAHNILLAHGYTVQLYRQKYQAQNKGKIGITLNCDWAEPLDPTNPAHVAVAQRQLEFSLGWFADPVFLGDYPASMKLAAGDRLPTFSDEEKAIVNGSHDFFGLNHYTASYLFPKTDPDTDFGWQSDLNVSSTHQRGSQMIGPLAGSSWLYVVPWGFRKMLNWIKERYGDPDIYVTENGVSVPNEPKIPFPDVLNDQFRINYLQGYLSELENALNDGVKVKGYFVWSLMDNFEWARGYTERFGIHYVDYNSTNLNRYVKDSANYYSNYVQNATSSPASGSNISLLWLMFLIFPIIIIVIAIAICISSRDDTTEMYP